MNTRQDWPLGPALKQHREACGLSVKAAARRTNKKVSDGRWYQLESGYQQIKGQRIPISTTAATVAAAAKAVDWEVAEALALAGFDPVDVPSEDEGPLRSASHDELLAEVRRRMQANSSESADGLDEAFTPKELVGQIRVLFAELRRQVPTAAAAVDDAEDWPESFFEGVGDEPPPVRRRENGENGDKLGNS